MRLDARPEARDTRTLPLRPMKHDYDKQKIRELIDTWMQATAAGDWERVLSLMAEDVVFLMPGRPPLQGRASFAATLEGGSTMPRIEGRSDIQEIHVAGDFAFCWSNLAVTVTPSSEGLPIRRAGPVLSVFRREPDGSWVLFRDANMLVAV